MKTLHAVVAATMPKHLTLATARALLSIKPNLKMLITPALLGALLLSPVLGRAQVSSSLQAYCDDLGREAIILAQARDCGASQEDLLNNARGQLSQSARGDILETDVGRHNGRAEFCVR